jgi:hypothetical protein
VSRLAPLPYDSWDLDALADGAPGMKPPPVNVLGLFARHPDLARAFLSDETYRALSASFDERQLLDLVFTVGTYALLAMAFNSFGLELDPGLSADDFERET